MTNVKASGLPRGVQRRGKILRVYLTHNDGKVERRSVGMVSVATAVKMRSKWQVEIAEGKYIKKVVQTDAMTFDEIADDWLVERREECSKSLETVECRLKLVRQWFETKAAREITPDDIKAKMTEAATEREWSDQTWNAYRLVVSGIFKLAVENQKVSTNPAVTKKTKLRKVNNQRTEFLSHEEAATLRAVIAMSKKKTTRDRVYDFDLAINTGLRHSEMYGRSDKYSKSPGLVWSDVHLDKGFLIVRDTKNRTDRTVPLNEKAAAALVELQKRHKSSPRVMVNKNGKDYRDEDMEWFEKALKRAGIRSGVKGITWHSLRHTFASHLVMAGTPLLTVSRLLGHSSIKMTERYSHLAPDSLAAAVRLLDKIQTVPLTVPPLPRVSQLHVN